MRLNHQEDQRSWTRTSETPTFWSKILVLLRLGTRTLLQICQSNKLWFRMMYLTEMHWRDMLIHQESKSLALALTHHLLMRINWAASKWAKEIDLSTSEVTTTIFLSSSIPRLSCLKSTRIRRKKCVRTLRWSVATTISKNKLFRSRKTEKPTTHWSKTRFSVSKMKIFWMKSIIQTKTSSHLICIHKCRDLLSRFIAILCQRQETFSVGHFRLLHLQIGYCWATLQIRYLHSIVATPSWNLIRRTNRIKVGKVRGQIRAKVQKITFSSKEQKTWLTWRLMTKFSEKESLLHQRVQVNRFPFLEQMALQVVNQQTLPFQIHSSLMTIIHLFRAQIRKIQVAHTNLGHQHQWHLHSKTMYSTRESLMMKTRSYRKKNKERFPKYPTRFLMLLSWETISISTWLIGVIRIIWQLVCLNAFTFGMHQVRELPNSMIIVWAKIWLPQWLGQD